MERMALRKPLLLSDVLHQEEYTNVKVFGMARLGHTQYGDICFCDREPGTGVTVMAEGSIVLCTTDVVESLHVRFPKILCIIMPDPRATFIDLGHRLLGHAELEVSSLVPRPFGIHSSVIMGENCVIDPETRIDANVVLGHQCIVKRGTWIQEGAIIRDNTVLGVEGINAYKGLDGRQRNFPHLAGVIIGESVEVGASVVVVRGILNSTVIGKGSVIGNMSNIGHVVEIGENVWMSVGCLIGGHTCIGDAATIGMGVTIRDNLNIGSRVQVGMASVVVKSIPEGASVFGNPAKPIPGLRAGPNR